jgi:transposase
VFILCRSAQRALKEKAMHDKFADRIQKGLEAMQKSCVKRMQDPVKISIRLGRLLGKNTRGEGAFKVEVKTRSDGGAELVWEKESKWTDWAALSEGCYLLRTNIADWSPQELWRAYMQLTQAEAAFRIHKSDLSLRPVWHQKKERVQAHILVCFLAYVLWKTLEQMCRAGGLGDEPRKVLDEIGRIQSVDVLLPTRGGVILRRRVVSRPTEHQAILLHRLDLRLPDHLPLPKACSEDF